MGRRVFRNYYKGHMDKTKGEGGSKRGRWVWMGWGRKYRQVSLNNNKIILKYCIEIFILMYFCCLFKFCIHLYFTLYLTCLTLVSALS